MSINNSPFEACTSFGQTLVAFAEAFQCSKKIVRLVAFSYLRVFTSRVWFGPPPSRATFRIRPRRLPIQTTP